MQRWGKQFKNANTHFIHRRPYDCFFYNFASFWLRNSNR